MLCFLPCRRTTLTGCSLRRGICNGRESKKVLADLLRLRLRAMYMRFTLGIQDCRSISFLSTVSPYP